ncbi:hypothetical protein PT974_05897 [Cladobotryum mycophilum]|uniref:Something about silencing protein 4 domain-containing protein n=1 Tax=Cladobotryum mycophilum TaxID=491253 RepID=A0ABR0SL63_9HYPO
MASVTRSNRRAEGLHPQHHNVNASGPLTRSGPGPSLFHHSNAAAGVAGGRMKRALEIPDRDFDTVKPKKTRIAVEIIAKSHVSIENVNVQLPAVPRQPAVANGEHRPTTAAAVSGQPTTTKPTVPAPPEQDHTLTKHQAKVINGIKHELDRLQPKAVDTKEQGRKLRSQEATRFKSELSAYFPDYDEVIGNDPKEEHLLNPDTPIVIVDSKSLRAAPEVQRAAYRPHHTIDCIDFPVRGYGDALFTEVFDSQRIDFGFLEAQHKTKNIEDPLPNSLFESTHKRAERLERSIRNTEKGRAQHEKDQIIRLLDGLQGHDWLRVMGVSGVTETKKRTFESARMHFIRGCQAILDKFRNWSLEEKRRKLEKEKALAEKAEKDGEGSDNADGHGTDESGSRVIRDSDDEEEEDDAEDPVTSQDDASEASSPAKQLRQEARARSKMAAIGSKKPRSSRKPILPTKPPEPPKEFKSFFTKKYERDGALHRHRRAGRKVLAWGHPIPDMLESDFILPEEYRDEDTLKSRARKKRRDKRESRQL